MGVEDCDWTDLLAGGDGGGDVVGSGCGGHDSAGGVEDGVDDDVQALAGPRRPEQQDRVLDRGPDLHAAGASEQVSDVAGPGAGEAGPQGRTPCARAFFDATVATSVRVATPTVGAGRAGSCGAVSRPFARAETRREERGDEYGEDSPVGQG
ncbi:MAG: hypothetical protein R2693_07060 [Nocardioidaceae bacterium]